MNRIVLLLAAGLLASAAMAQNVGIGNSNPHTRLEVTGAISSTPVSAAAAASIAIPNNTSIFRIAPASGRQANALTVATAQEGQYLTIYNEDDDTATFAGSSIAALTGVMSYEYIHAAWRVVSSNQAAIPATTIYNSNGTLTGHRTVTLGPDTLKFSSTTGNLIFAPTSTGRVGIGTTAPQQLLDVAGTTRTTAYQMPTGAGKNYVLTSDSLGNGRWIKSSFDSALSALKPQPNTGPCLTAAVSSTSLQTGDQRYSVVYGQYVYVNTPSTYEVRIYDVSDPAHPTQAGSIPFTFTPYYPMPTLSYCNVIGHYLYAMQPSNSSFPSSLYVNIYDLSNPLQPTLVDSVGTSTDHIVVSGHYAFFNTQVFDVSQPAHPVAVGTLSGRYLAISGHYAYTINGSTGYSYDITDPTHPILLSTTSLGGSAGTVAASGSYEYMIINNGTLATYNVSDPAHPALVSTQNTVSAGMIPVDLTISGTVLYAHSDNGIAVYDIFDPSHPALIQYLNDPSASLSFANGYVYSTYYDLKIYGNSCQSTPTALTVSAAGTLAALPGSVSNASIGNQLSTTVNGVTGASVPIISSHQLTLSSANEVTSIVNGVASNALTLPVGGAMANTLSNDYANNMTSEVDGLVSSAPIITDFNAYIQGNNLQLEANGFYSNPIGVVTSVSNTRTGNTLTTIVNGVYAAAVPVIGSVSAATATNNLTITVNGVTSGTAPIINSVSNTSSANTIRTTVNGVAGATVPIINSISNTSAANTLSTTVNGLAGATVPIVNSISNTSSANTLSTTVNGVAGATVPIINTNTLGISGATLTSTVNGVASSVSIPGAITTNTLGISGSTLTSTVNGVASAVTLPATTHTLGISGSTLTSTVNGVASNVTLPGAVNIYNTDGTLTGSRTVAMGSNNLAFTGTGIISTAGSVGIGTTNVGGTYPVTASKLYVNGPTQTTNLSAAALKLEQYYVDMGGSSLVGPAIMFNTNNTANAWNCGAIAGVIGTPASTGSYPGGLAFFTKGADNNAAGQPIERVRITSGGYVGIGTPTPACALDVQGQVRALSSNLYGGPYSGYISIGSTSTGYAWKVTGAAPDQGTWDAFAVLGTSLQFRAYSESTLQSTTWLQVNRGSGINISSVMFPNGYVGIGSSTPQVPLDVQINNSTSYVATNAGLRTYYFAGSGLNLLQDNGTGSGNVAIKANGWIWAANGFMAASDQRIKNVIGQSDATADLASLCRIRVTDYTMRDQVASGSRVIKKVIAQQVQQAYPAAVKTNTVPQIIPDIYQVASSYTLSGARLYITLSTPLRDAQSIKAGAPCRFYLYTRADSSQQEQKGTIVVVDSTHITLALTTPLDQAAYDGRLFVYGTEVTDLLSVDYEAIAMLNVSATQALADQLREAQTRITKLTEQNEKTNTANTQLRSDVDKLKASLESLTQIITRRAER